MLSMKIELDGRSGGMMVRWSSGRQHVFHPLWLRESSTEPGYRDAGNGMRIPQASTLPLDISVQSATIVGDRIDVVFSDGHQCQFFCRGLLSSVIKQRSDDLVGEKVLWDGTFTDYPRFALASLRENESILLDMLDAVATYGFACIDGLDNDEDGLMEITECIGSMRETNWGTISDVKNIPNPYDLTMTTRSLAPHADNPYRLPAPGYIFMQCLRNDADGGESTMVDGFAAATRLKQTDEDAYNALTSIAPNFRHAEASAILEDSGPLTELNEEQELISVRFSNRTEQVPPLPPKVGPILLWSPTFCRSDFFR